MYRLQLFKCVPLNVKLFRKACAERHERSQREQRHERTAGKTLLVGSQRCATCRIGEAHARGEAPTTWEDGSPIELPVVPSSPAPGTTNWTTPPSERPTAEPIELPTEPPPRPPPAARKEPTKMATGQKYTYRGKSLTTREWAREPEIKALGLTSSAIYMRMRGGWPVDKALSTPKGEKLGTSRVVTTAAVTRLEKMVRPSSRAPSKAKPKSAPKSKPAPKRKSAAARAPSSGFRVVALLDDVEIASSNDPDVWRDLVVRVRGASA